MNWILDISKHEQKFHRRLGSQGKQDGVIAFIFENIKPVNDPPYYVEFGYQGDEGANTFRLRNQKGWEGLLLDQDLSCPDLNLHKEFITSANIVDTFKKYNVPSEPDYISIDVDSTDLWIFKAILEEYKPILVSVEFNPNIPIDYSITFPDSSEETWEKDRVFGASLKALNSVANNYNYSLVYAGDYRSSHHHDAFFIRDDRLDNLETPSLEGFAYTYLSEPISWADPPMPHPACETGRHKIMLDYEEYERTKDVNKSREKARSVCEKYLGQNKL